MTPDQLVDDAMEKFITRSDSHATRKTYTADLKHFFSWLGCAEGSPTANEVRAVSWRTITAYRDEFYTPDKKTRRSKLSAETGARRMSVIAAFYDDLEREGIVEKNPAHGVRRPKQSNEGKTAGLKPEDVNAILSAIERETFAGERNLLLLSVLFFQWLRVAEAVRIKVEDFVNDGGIPTLFVRAKGGKTRQIALRKEVQELAENYVRRFKVTGFLFPALSPGAPTDQPMSTEAARLVFKKLCARAGLDASRFSPHSARVSGITAALNANVPLDVIQEAAGHSNVQTTLRYSRARKRLFGEATAAMPFKIPGAKP